MLGLWLWLWLGLGLDTQQTTLVTCILTFFFARLLRVVYDVATHSSSSLVTNLLTYFFARLLGVVYDVATHEHHANEDAREVDQRASEDELYDGEAEQGHRSGRQHAWLGSGSGSGLGLGLGIGLGFRLGLGLSLGVGFITLAPACLQTR